MKKGHTRAIAVLFLTGFLFPAASHATTTWDLQTDWNNAQNAGVGGAWSYRSISGGLFNLLQSPISSPIPSPIPSSNTLWNVVPPGSSLTRLTDSSNSLAGIAANTTVTCPEGAASGLFATCRGGGLSWPSDGSIGGVAYDVRWTSPVAETIWVTGDVWMMRSLEAAQQTLDVKLQGVNQGTVNIPTASRALDPYLLTTAYGASFLQNIHVSAGETLDFIVNVGQASSNRYDFVGMDLQIIGLNYEPLNDVPEPSTWGLMVSGLAATGILLRRKKA